MTIKIIGVLLAYMDEQWLTATQVRKITGQSIATIIRYGRKGYYEIRRVGKDTRPILYNYLSIPTYLRKFPLESEVKNNDST